MKLIYLVVVFLLFAFAGFAQNMVPANPKTSGIFRAHEYQQYLLISGGYGLYYDPYQKGMETHQNPVDISLELGRFNRSLNYTASFVMTEYTQDRFVYKPKFITLGLKYSFKQPSLPDWLEPFINGGIAGWQGILTDSIADGNPRNVHQNEKDQGLAAFLKVGADLAFGRFILTPHFSVFIAQDGDYLSQAPSKKFINPSLHYAGIQLGYRLPYNGIPLINTRIKTLSRVK